MSHSLRKPSAALKVAQAVGSSDGHPLLRKPPAKQRRLTATPSGSEIIVSSALDVRSNRQAPLDLTDQDSHASAFVQDDVHIGPADSGQAAIAHCLCQAVSVDSCHTDVVTVSHVLLPAHIAQNCLDVLSSSGRRDEEVEAVLNSVAGKVGVPLSLCHAAVCVALPAADSAPEEFALRGV